MPDLERLSSFDTPTICNVIELFNVRSRTAGYMDASIKAAFPEMEPMVGYAATATCRATVNADTYGLPRQVARFEELSGPPIVVFQDLDNPVVAADFGEVMCTTYKAFGAVGLVTSGPGRDLEQVRDIGFPVFTNGAICSHGYFYIQDVHVPVHVGGLIVYPDDLLHGDLNGVTTIPKEIADEIPDVAEEFIAAEAVIITAMRQESVSVKLLEEATAEAHARMDALRQRVARG